MTQTASIDFAAPRQDVAAPASRKGQGDFMRTMKDVQERETADAPSNVRADRPEKIDRPEQAERPDAPAEQQAPTAEAPVADRPAERPATEAPKQEAPAEKPPEAEAEAPTPPQTTEEAQAAIALALATGVQLVQKAQEAQLTVETTVADATAPVTTEVKAMTAQTQAQVPVTDVEAEAQLKLLAEQAKAQALAAGKAEAPVPTQAQAAASATEQAEVPALLSQAASGLGKVSMQTTTEAAPTAPQAQAAPESEEGIANLAFQLLVDAPEETTTPGSTTQATLLDDVTDIETTSQAVNLLDGDETEATAGEEKRADGVNLLNGDRTATSETGKAAGIKAHAPAAAEDVMPQILKHAEQIRAAQSNAVKLQLYPENLGKMEIKVTSHQGVISAQLTAENQQVKSMLETQVAHLQRSFAEMGLKVDKVEVTLASANLNFDAQGGAAQGQEQGNQQRSNGSPQAFSGNGYEQWLGEDPADERYAELAGATAINYVA